MQINLERDDCEHWKFYAEWIKGREVAVWQPGNRWNPTARNTLNRIRRTEYHSAHAEWPIWNASRNQIFAVNTSAEHRQGRRMTDGYWQYPAEKNITNTCPKHSYELFTVDLHGWIVAYSIIHRCGDYANISTIIGHADHLRAGVMYALMSEIQKWAADAGINAMTYGEWDSGTKGLQYWKHSTGFTKMQLHE